MNKVVLTEGRTLMSKFLINSLFLIVISLFLIFLMDNIFYKNWFGFLSISIIPSLIIINTIWQFKHPALLSRIETQPWRGLSFTVFAAVVGLSISFVGMKWIGHNIAPPTPFLMMFAILSVVMTMWQLLVFEGWPFNGMCSAIQGWAVLGTSYALAYLCYALFFDFSLLTGAPESWLAIAPQGLFEPWSAIVYFITTLGVIFAWQLLEFKPLSLLRYKETLVGRQPFYGLLLGGAVLLISLLVFKLGTGYFKADPVSFMVRGPISFLFGMFLIMDTTANKAFASIKQPSRGFLLIVLSMLLGFLLCICYEWFMYWMLNLIVSGAPSYVAELWLANAMLSMTFPLILIYCHFFNYWPIEPYVSGLLVSDTSSTKGSKF